MCTQKNTCEVELELHENSSSEAILTRKIVLIEIQNFDRKIMQIKIIDFFMKIVIRILSMFWSPDMIFPYLEAKNMIYIYY